MIFFDINEALAKADELAQIRCRAIALVQHKHYIILVYYEGQLKNGNRKHMAIVWPRGCFGTLNGIRKK